MIGGLVDWRIGGIAGLKELNLSIYSTNYILMRNEQFTYLTHYINNCIIRINNSIKQSKRI